MVIVVLVTIPRNKAQKLAQIIVKNRLCACVNIVNDIKSLFWWQGKIDSAQEALLVIKTRKKLFLSLQKEIKKHHPYTIPEIISFKVEGINSEYKQWLKKETS